MKYLPLFLSLLLSTLFVGCSLDDTDLNGDFDNVLTSNDEEQVFEDAANYEEITPEFPSPDGLLEVP